MHKPQGVGASALSVIMAALTLFALVFPLRTLAGDFEVWLVDQSNSRDQTFGGAIHIWSGANLNGPLVTRPAPTGVIDLAGATAQLCLDATGANPVRPHMLRFNTGHTHAILSFVASGHVVIFDAASRHPLACIRTSPGAGGARQAHAAFEAPDNSYLLVANQNGKLLERINTNYATNTFVLDTAATLNLETCMTPNGVSCQLAGVRPDNAPICPIVDRSSSLGFVTLRGGGLFVVDPKATPMQIVAEYDLNTVHGNGCGGLQVGQQMYVNSGGGTAANLTEFDVYSFPLSGYSPTNPVNTPAPVLLYSDDNGERDSHGMVATNRQKYVWVFDRAINVAEVFDAASGAIVNSVDLNVGAPPGSAPDLADISPFGNRIFVSLRGPNPLSGDPHVSTGTVPGLGVIQVTEGGRSGFFRGVVPIHNIDAGGIERADAHGIRVRLKN